MQLHLDLEVDQGRAAEDSIGCLLVRVWTARGLGMAARTVSHSDSATVGRGGGPLWPCVGTSLRPQRVEKIWVARGLASGLRFTPLHLRRQHSGRPDSRTAPAPSVHLALTLTMPSPRRPRGAGYSASRRAGSWCSRAGGARLGRGRGGRLNHRAGLLIGVGDRDRRCPCRAGEHDVRRPGLRGDRHEPVRGHRKRGGSLLSGAHANRQERADLDGGRPEVGRNPYSS
jgi:hypothetical protein